MAVADAIRLDVLAVGVCGTDLQRHRSGFSVQSLGHELVAREPGHPPGRLAPVAVRPLSPCRECRQCRRQRTELCPADASIGRYDTGEGGFSGSVRVAPDQVYPLPDGLGIEVATLADPLACVHHALRGHDLGGTDVLVVGDGALAALAGIAARLRGARQVTIAVKQADRSARVAPFCDRTAVGADVPADTYDVVVEAVGYRHVAAMALAIRAVAPLGAVVALGVYPPDLVLDLPLRSLLEKESTLQGSKAYRVGAGTDDFADALTVLAAEQHRFAPVVTATPAWSPSAGPVPDLERRSALKTVYVNESAVQ